VFGVADTSVRNSTRFSQFRKEHKRVLNDVTKITQLIILLIIIAVLPVTIMCTYYRGISLLSNTTSKNPSVEFEQIEF